MKNNFIICFLLCISIPAIAQKSANSNALSFVGGIERSVYWDLSTTYLGIDYERQLTPAFKIAAGAGTSFGNNGYTTSGVDVDQKLLGISQYARLFLSLFPKQKKFDSNIGLGGRYFYYKANYTENAVISVNGTTSISYNEYKRGQLAAAFILQEMFYLNERISLGLTGEYNAFFKKSEFRPLSTTVIEYTNTYTGTTSSESYPLSPLHLTLKVGYRF